MENPENEKEIIFVVDGDCTRRFLTSLFLQRLDYHVFPVGSAEEALVALELTVPLLVITEIALPRMTGIDLLKSIRQGTAAKRVPVLVYTCLKEPSYREACMNAGCTAYLTQPADHNRLYEAIQRATDRPRSVVRLPTSLDVIIEGEAGRGGSRQKERVTAISEHGMFVSTPTPLPRGSVLLFTLFLDRSMAWGIMVEGTVLYSSSGQDAGRQTGMGVKFSQIRAEDREAIRNFIGRKLLAGIAVPVPKS